MLSRISGKMFLGIETAEDPFAPSRRKWLFVTYSVMAVAYRWLITFSIFWFVYRVLEPYGLKILGQMLAVMAVYGLVGMPLVKLYKYFSIPGRTSMVKPVRLAGTLIAVGMLLGVIMLIPIPRYVYGSFYIEPQGVETVYVEEPGSLAEIYIQPNEFVEQGTPLVQLASPDLDQQLVGLESTVHNALIELSIAQKAEMDRAVGQMTPGEAEAAVETAKANWTKKDSDRQRLLIGSPRAGFFLAAHRKPVPNSDSGDHGVESC